MSQPISGEELERRLKDLIRLLVKLLKIYRHSDPSAPEMKTVLLKRYKQQISFLQENLREHKQMGYEEIITTLNDAVSQSATTAIERQQILKKLKHDVGDVLLDSPELPQFTTNPKGIKRARMEAFLESQKKQRNRKPEQFQVPRKRPLYYTKNDLMELVHEGYAMRRRRKMQKKAENELTSFLTNMRKRDPDQIAATILHLAEDSKKNSTS